MAIYPGPPAVTVACGRAVQQYLRAYENGREVQAGLTGYFDFYNRERIHQSHEYQTPDEIYFATGAGEPLAMAA